MSTTIHLDREGDSPSNLIDFTFPDFIAKGKGLQLCTFDPPQIGTSSKEGFSRILLWELNQTPLISETEVENEGKSICFLSLIMSPKY